MLGQAVDGNPNRDPGQGHPLGGDGDHGAGHHQGVHAHLAQLRQDTAQLAMAYERLASYQGDVQRLMLAYQADDAFNKPVSAEIRNFG